MSKSASKQTGDTASSESGSAFSREDCPPELDPYWESRIKEDRVWYGHYAESGERFYAPQTDQIYRVTNVRHDGDVFDLEPCAVATDLADGFGHPTDADPHRIDNICALAGAVELGELIHLEKGTFREVGESAYLSVGELTVEIDDVSADPDTLRKRIRTPSGPDANDLARVAPALSDAGVDATLYAPLDVSRTEDPKPEPESQPEPRRLPAGAQDVETHFIPVSPFSKWTFEDDSIRNWVERTFEEGETILNACAGNTKLTPPPGGEILRNDINSERDADFHVDVAELAAVDSLEEKSIDRIIFDPPWSLYQSNLRYQGEHVHQVSKDGTHDIDLSELPFDTPGPGEKTQVGHAAIAKRGFDYLLKPGGEVLELTFHGTSMPSSMGYERQARVIFDPVGEARAVIGSIDQKARQELSAFL
jgi:hypothetical protein